MLKSIARKRYFITEDLRKAKMAVNNIVQLIFPEFKKLFSNIYGESALAILKEYPSVKKLAKAHCSKLASLIHGRCKCTAEQLINAAKHSIGLSDEWYTFELQDAIAELEHIQKRIATYDAQIKRYVNEVCPNILTIPGVGYVTAGLILGEIGDISRFRSADALVSFSGLDLTVFESGKYKALHVSPSKKGSVFLRYALFQVSRIIWQCNSTFRAYYEKKQAEGKHHYVILGHIQKKLVRVIFSVLINNSVFQERPV